jgi:hypothetical protein
MSETNDVNGPLPPGIGPHEGRECELMLAGLKPLAMFSDAATHCHYFPEAEFAPHVAAGRIIKREETIDIPEDGLVLRCLYYALPNEVWRITAAHDLKKALLQGLRKPSENDEIAIGRLLGYSDDDIQAFLRHTRAARMRSRR